MKRKRKGAGERDRESDRLRRRMSIRNALTESLAEEAIREYESGADGAGLEDPVEEREDLVESEGSFLAELEEALDEGDQMTRDAHDRIDLRSPNGVLQDGWTTYFDDDHRWRPANRPRGLRRKKRKSV